VLFTPDMDITGTEEADFICDVPSAQEDMDENVEREIFNQRAQAPPAPGTVESALIDQDVDANVAPLAELSDVPMVKKRKINRGPVLNVNRLLGERGLPAIQSYFEAIKFKGKGHESEDLNKFLSALEHWAHRLFPKLAFDDCLEKIESLGQKREIKVAMRKMRLGESLLDANNQTTVVTQDGPAPETEEEPFNPFEQHRTNEPNPFPYAPTNHNTNTPVATTTTTTTDDSIDDIDDDLMGDIRLLDIDQFAASLDKDSNSVATTDQEAMTTEERMKKMPADCSSPMQDLSLS